MKPPTIPGAGRMALFLSILACTSTTVHAEDNEISTWAETEIPDWATANAMQLSLSAKTSLQFAVIPLTPNLGLNDTTGRVIQVRFVRRFA